jgi:hypothetical protein
VETLEALAEAGCWILLAFMYASQGEDCVDIFVISYLVN